MKNLSKKTLTQNFVWNLAYQFLITALPLITAPYLARVLGPERIGTYSFGHSIVSCFALFAATGTALYGQRAIAMAHAEGGSQKQLFIELLLLRGMGVAIALGIYLELIYPAVDEPSLYAIMAVEILAVAMDISWFFQGTENFDIITICSGAAKILAAVGIFLFVKTKDDLYIYAMLSGGAIFFGDFLQWAFLPAVLRNESLSKLRILRHIKPVSVLFASQIAIQTYTILDKTMIGLIAKSDSESGYYDQAQRLIRALTSCITALGTVMASRVAVVWNSGEPVDRKRKIEQLLLISFRLIFAIGFPISAGLYVIAPRFVPIFYGDGFETVAGLVCVMSWIIPVVGCSNIIGMQWLVPSGRENLVTLSVMIGAVVNVLMNLLLIPSMAALGAVVSSVLAEIAVTGVQFALTYRELPCKEILKIAVRYGGYTAIMLLLGKGMDACLPKNAYSVVCIILSCFCVYAGMLLLTNDPLLREARSR